jgi:hypothetical protein
MKSRVFLRAISIFILAAVAVSPLSGQGFTAVVLGTVNDNTGAVVPGATVTASNLRTGVKSAVTTDERGNFTLLRLQPGEYRVEAEMPGFKRAVREPVTLQVDQRQALNFNLELGAVEESMTVTAETSQLQTETATVGTVVTNIQTSELPLNGRNFLQLNLLVPGAAPSIKGSNLSSQGGGIVVHGLPENSNYFWVDGVDNTTQTIGQYVVNVPPYSIEEFRVMSPTYDSEFGRTPGAQINVITRSGGNSYHGDTYLFIRNSVFDAKNFFDPPGKIPAFRRGQYGADFSGKIVRDKVFFYGAFEGLTFAEAQSAKNIVPTHQQTLGDFSDLGSVIRDPVTGQAFPGNIIPADRLNPTGLAYAAFYPPPNSGPNSLLVSPTWNKRDNVIVSKGDWVISPKDRLTFRYAFQSLNFHQPIGQFSNSTNIPGFGIDQIDAHNITTGLSMTHTFSPRLIAEFRMGWNRFEFNYFPQARTQDWCAVLAIQGCDEGPRNWNVPAVSLNSVYSSLGGNAAGNQREPGPFDTTFVDPVLTVIKGKHTMKFGWDFHHFFTYFTNFEGPRGTFTFRGTWTGNPLADLLLGLPFQATKNVVANMPNDGTFLMDMNATAAFAQDDFRVSSNLSLNIGLRYELNFPATERRNHMANLDLSNGVANARLKIENQDGVGKRLYEPDYREYAPRFGFAFTPGDNWAVRGGYGIFYQLILENSPQNLHYAPPFFSGYTIVGDGNRITINNALVAGLVANVPNFNAFTQHLKNGTIHQFSIGVQHALTPTLVVDAGYVGNRGRHIDANLAQNTPLPGPGAVQPRRPNVNWGNINLFGPHFSSQYDGFEARLEKRISKGLHFLTSYTLSRALDDAGTPQDPRNLKAQWGPSNFDIKNHLAFSYVYELPVGSQRTFMSNAHGLQQAVLGGWQLNGIYQYRSGQPFTPVLAIDNTNTQQNQDRPNQVGDPFLSTSSCQTRTPTCWANAAAFATPAPFTFGTAPKNGVRGPSFSQLDFGLAKNFPFGENRKVEFRAEAFNILNHVNLNNPVATLSSSFGVISTAENPRQMQFGLRFVF